MSKMVTRTFENTVCTLMGITIENNEPKIVFETYTITDKVDKKQAQKFVDKYYTGKIEHPAVKEITIVSELIGVTPQKFYAMGIKLDPVTRKPLNAEDGDEEIEEA